MKHIPISLVGTIALTILSSTAALAEGVTVKTKIVPKETLVEMTEFTLPTPPPGPFYFTLPMDIKIAKDANVTTDTPVTDRYGIDKLEPWLAAIRQCLKESPKLLRTVGEEQVPFNLMGTEGKVVLNANDKPVCPAP
jgi:hypothetical protein